MCVHGDSTSTPPTLMHVSLHLQVPTRTLVGLLVSKLMLHPLLGTAGITVASQAGLLPDTDALMVLVMLLVWCTPTAVLTHSLATMLQVGGANRALCLSLLAGVWL